MIYGMFFRLLFHKGPKEDTEFHKGFILKTAFPEELKSHLTLYIFG